MSPDEVEHISTTKKNKIKELSPKRRHLKRPASPMMIEKTRPLPIKKKDKADKVWKFFTFNMRENKFKIL